MSRKSTPQFIMDEVKLLFGGLTTPESEVNFNPPSRTKPATIKNSIDPPEATWIWANQAARMAQAVNRNDLGKYGMQTDTNTLFRLVSVSPLVWEPVQNFTSATWTWPNVTARNAQPVTQGDVGETGLQTDINTYYRLTGAAPAVWQPVANPMNTSPLFELSKGAADADSFHDFFRLQIAFEDVWSELLDSSVEKLGQQAYAQWDALMDQSRDDSGKKDRLTHFEPAPKDGITGADELQNFIDNLKVVLGIPPNGQQEDINSFDFGPPAPGVHAATPVNNSPSNPPPPPPEVRPPDLTKLLTALDTALKESYRFDVFAPASINYGLLLNYRQHWRPQSYQVGNLVSTIPLAPQETRRYTTKTVVKKTRNVKEIDDSLRSGKDESSNTWRIDAEIVDRAKNQTNFQKNVSGSYGNDNAFKVSAGMQQGQDQAMESAQTKREFHEAVVKSAQEYKNEHRLEITTEESREDEGTSYREIRNPNDELTVTYLFYELQRRYLVEEKLHKATPVILVANEVPAPHEIDEAWILRYDWIIKRAILDDSFLPALEYLSANYTGENVTLQVLALAVAQQKLVVERVSKQVQLANKSLDASTLGLEATENQAVQKQQQDEAMKFVKSFFDPLGLTQTGNRDGNSDRSRIDFAKDALNRAQAKANKLTSDLKTEITAMQVAIDKYTAAATKHFSMLADIDRLRVHVKDNIIHYMQAIWTYEPSDQRYFRLYNLDVPVFTHNTVVDFERSTEGIDEIDLSHTTLNIVFPPPTLLVEPNKLHQVADLENLIGFKGNYMIFPMINFNYMTWFMMQDYIDLAETTGVTVKEPDPLANVTIKELTDAMDAIRANDPVSFARNQKFFEEVMLRLLSNRAPEMVIVPSNSLYIEALPGTHPLLEDFKLIHRAIDVKKAQAEARRAELENLRLGARLSTDERGDPDIDRVVVVGNGKNVTVDAGQ